MKETKQDEFRGQKIIASALIFSIGVLSITIAIFTREIAFILLPAIMASLGLYLFVGAWCGKSIFGLLIAAWKYTDSYTERVMPDEIKAQKTDEPIKVENPS